MRVEKSRALAARRLGFEFVVVLLGVLGALAVDDYRDWRADRQLERHALDGILEGLSRDQEDLRQGARTARSRAGASLFALKRAGEDVPVGTQQAGEMTAVIDSIADGMDFPRAARLIGFVTDFEVSGSTYDELVSSGQLSVLANVKLRSAPADYYYRTEFVADFAASLRARPLSTYEDVLAGYGWTALALWGADEDQLEGLFRSEPRARAVARSMLVGSERQARLQEELASQAEDVRSQILRAN